MFQRLLLLIGLIDALCEEGQLVDAEEVLNIMIQQDQNPNIVTYYSLMDGYCLEGQMDKARNVFDSMISMGCQPDILSYNILINGYFKKNRPDCAMDCRGYLDWEGMTLQ